MKARHAAAVALVGRRTSTSVARMTYTPGKAGKVFEESARLQRPAPAPTTVDPEVAELFRRYGWEIGGPPRF